MPSQTTVLIASRGGSTREAPRTTHQDSQPQARAAPRALSTPGAADKFAQENFSSPPLMGRASTWDLGISSYTVSNETLYFVLDANLHSCSGTFNVTMW